MNDAPRPTDLRTLATAAPGAGQRRFAGLACAAFTALSFALLPVAGRPMVPMPGFVASYQSALVVVYAVTTVLFFAQYGRTRSVPLLVLSAGSLYVTLIVAVQLLSFPNVFGADRILGSSPATTTWLWTLWHLGPPLFALPYAIMEGDGRTRLIEPDRSARAGIATAIGVAAAVAGLSYLVVAHVDRLPTTVVGDDYWALTTSGIGPAVVALTLASLAILCWTTRLRSLLQLWLAVSLFLLLLDNLVTQTGAARGTVGWFAGRIEALISGVVVLCAYLRKVDLLYGHAERIAEARERQRADLQGARDHLAIALDAADMGDWEFDLAAGASRRSLRHDAIFGYDALQPRWDVATTLAHVVREDRDVAEAAFAAVAVDAGLVGRAEEILEGFRGIDRFDKNGVDLPRIQGEADQFDAELARLAVRVGLPDVEALTRRQPSDAVRARVETLIRDGQEDAAAIARLERDLAAARTEHEGLLRDVAEGGTPVDPTPFRETLRPLAAIRGVIAERDALDATVRRAEQVLRGQAARLSPPVA
ncbi:MASE4 domain-containing protein, partial [Methylobacterium sp. WL116]|uniref:MASE4 domain-containing protein n=1 Tax=Methylobacterium sp. WL116 TaxID=2603889 RepID=UPI0011D80A0B